MDKPDLKLLTILGSADGPVALDQDSTGAPTDHGLTPSDLNSALFHLSVAGLAEYDYGAGGQIRARLTDKGKDYLSFLKTNPEEDEAPPVPSRWSNPARLHAIQWLLLGLAGFIGTGVLLISGYAAWTTWSGRLNELWGSIAESAPTLYLSAILTLIIFALFLRESVSGGMSRRL